MGSKKFPYFIRNGNNSYSNSVYNDYILTFLDCPFLHNIPCED